LQQVHAELVSLQTIADYATYINTRTAAWEATRA